MTKGSKHMSKVIKCQGCGAILQTDDDTKVGYALSLEHEYCQSCYRLMHYGEANIHFHPEDLPNLESDSLIVMVSSVLHLDMLFSYPVYRYQPEAHFVYVINQIDLLPNSTNLDKLVEKLTQRARSMNIPFQDIILMSAKNTFDIENLKKYLASYKHKNIYLLGVQNSGKTTLYKALTHQTKALAYKKAGLTQEALSAPFGDQIIYDMPGLYQEGYLHQLLPYEVYKHLIPENEIKPRIYQLKDQQTLILEGLISISFTGKDMNAVFYGHHNLKIHKTNASRVKDLLLNKEKHFDVYVDEYEEKALRIPKGKMQITFADMGFLHVVGPMHLKIIYPKGMHLSMTEAMFQ